MEVQNFSHNNQYTVWTEAKNVDTIIQVATQYFDSFTVQSSIGYWKGGQEESLQIVVCGPNNLKDSVFGFAQHIKELNKQEAVLVTEYPITLTLI